MTIWARVRDTATGHHFDVSLERMHQLVARGDAEEIAVDGHHKGRHEGRPCSPKPRRPLGTPAPQPKRAAKAAAEPKESESS